MAEAVTVVAVLTDVVDPAAGAVMATVGDGLTTVTLTAADVALTPARSVTFAVRATLPVAAGVHETV